MESSKLNSILEDTVDAPGVPFVSMLKALLLRSRHLRRNVNVAQESPQASRKRRSQVPKEPDTFAEKNFRTLTESAIEFCNGSSAEASGMKESLQDALSQLEQGKRVKHIVDALNLILLAYHGQTVGDLTHHPTVDDLIFVANDYDSASGDTKVTVAGTSLRTLSKLSPIPTLQSSSFKHWIKHLKSKAWIRDNEVCRLLWRDIWHCWDSTGARMNDVVFPEYELPMLLVPEPWKEFRMEDPPPHRDKIKKSDGKAPAHSRAVRIETVLPLPEDITPEKIIPSETQYEAVCNGVFLLCSVWDRIHSMNVILQDNWLSLRWYDPQGAIATLPIDLVNQLPLLVATVVLFQRFNLQMRGLASLELSAPTEDQDIPFDIPAESHSRWALKGRHGVFATPRLKGEANKPPDRSTTPPQGPRTRARARALAIASAAEFLSGLFFKLSWRDGHRPLEASLIAIAKERAMHYLHDPTHVTDHLPDVKLSEHYDVFSTRHIREYLGLKVSGSRVPSVLVTKKLQPFDTVKPDEFSKMIWQIIRCVYLLWKLGIAHGDISFWNMMVDRCSDGIQRAVLIDFDHTVIMEPGSLPPLTPPSERMGTLPFLAVDMAREPEKPLQRLLFHDLEAVLWCMVWYCQEQQKWRKGTFTDICAQKSLWTRHVDPLEPPSDIRKGTGAIWRAVVLAMQEWRKADEMTSRKPMIDQDWMELIRQQLDCPPEVGTEWMYFHIAPYKIRRADRDKTSIS